MKYSTLAIALLVQAASTQPLFEDELIEEWDMNDVMIDALDD